MGDEEYLSVKRIADRLDVGESTIWRWVSEKSFPKPMRVGKRVTRWRLSDVQRWEEEQLKAS
ncbi:AlpA family transcriptional regulator [Halomonas alkaliantarctica]|nr:AlpA family transcriptional regulator [Halomonas alkaliantarctica]